MDKKKQNIKQTKSRRTAADPAVRAKLKKLKREWKSLTARQRAEELNQKMLEPMSNYGIGEALGLSEAAIRQYKVQKQTVDSPPLTEVEGKRVSQNTPPLSTRIRTNQLTPEKKPGWCDTSRRLAAVIVSFLQGRNGAPCIRTKDVPDVLTQTQVRFSCEMYEPVQWYLPEKVSVAEIIRRTKPTPKPQPQWQVEYQADWLASIIISMTQDRNVRIRALECARKKTAMTSAPKQLLQKRSAPDPRSAPDWDDLNQFEQEFRIRRWLQS